MDFVDERKSEDVVAVGKVKETKTAGMDAGEDKRTVNFSWWTLTDHHIPELGYTF